MLVIVDVDIFLESGADITTLYLQDIPPHLKEN